MRAIVRTTVVLVTLSVASTVFGATRPTGSPPPPAVPTAEQLAAIHSLLNGYHYVPTRQDFERVGTQGPCAPVSGQ